MIEEMLQKVAFKDIAMNEEFSLMRAGKAWYRRIGSQAYVSLSSPRREGVKIEPKDFRVREPMSKSVWIKPNVPKEYSVEISYRDPALNRVATTTVVVLDCKDGPEAAKKATSGLTGLDHISVHKVTFIK